MIYDDLAMTTNIYIFLYIYMTNIYLPRKELEWKKNGINFTQMVFSTWTKTMNPSFSLSF